MAEEEQTMLFPSPEDMMKSEAPEEATEEEVEEEVDANADILARLERAERRNDELTNKLLRADEQEEPADDFAEVEVPSPIEDPDGFASAVQHNAEMKVKREMASRDDQASESSDLAEAWNAFGELHKDLADKPDLVGVAANLVNNDLTAQGLSPRKYISSQRDAYFEKILSKVEAVKRDLGVNSAAPSRTGGTIGSLSGKKVTKAKKGEEKPANFMDQLKSVQEATGHF